MALHQTKTLHKSSKLLIKISVEKVKRFVPLAMELNGENDKKNKALHGTSFLQGFPQKEGNPTILKLKTCQ